MPASYGLPKASPPPEAQLLRDIRHTQMTLPGTVEVRRRIGRFLFGARVELGEPISPTTRHNALCLRLSRYRQHDPGAGPLSGKHMPRLWEEAEVIVPVPEYETRRQTTVRDPWAVDIAFHLEAPTILKGQVCLETTCSTIERCRMSQRCRLLRMRYVTKVLKMRFLILIFNFYIRFCKDKVSRIKIFLVNFFSDFIEKK